MELLAVSPSFHRIHHDILRGHKGELFLDVAVDDLLMDHQSGTHILINIEDGIDREECLGHRDTLVSGIIQRPLKPLRSGCNRWILRVGDHIARQRANALTAHGIALIRHGGRTDLVLLKGLLHLLQMTQ